MHPIERLRWIARADGEPAASLVTEAAWTLADLAETEPQAVLSACRRLIERHPTCGPLYWAGATILTADDPVEAAHRISAALLDDPTTGHLATELNSSVTPGSVVVACEPAETLRGALERRPRYEVRLVGSLADLRSGVRMLAASGAEVTGYLDEELDEALDGAAVIVVEALAAGPSVALVTSTGAALAHEALPAALPCWLSVPTGRALPAPLVAAAVQAGLDSGEAEVLGPDEFTLAVGPGGAGDPASVVSASSCPAASELVAGRSAGFFRHR